MCEKYSYAQIFFNAETAHNFYFEVTDSESKKFLISEFKLDNSAYKVPLILGSLVGNWAKVAPLMFLKHFALNFVLPK